MSGVESYIALETQESHEQVCANLCDFLKEQGYPAKVLDDKTIHVGTFEARWKEIPPHPVNFFVMFYPDGHLTDLKDQQGSIEYCVMFACEARTWFDYKHEALFDSGKRVSNPLLNLVANHFNNKAPEPNNADLIISKKVLNGELDLFENVAAFIPDGWDIRKEGLNPLFPYKK